MERLPTTGFRIGAWAVNPGSSEISRNGETTHLEVRTMRLLVCLAAHAGDVVSIDELLNQVWSDVTVTPDSVYQAVASLRRALGDDSKQPTYIATVPRLGYRLLATVSSADAPAHEPPAPAPAPAPRSRVRAIAMWSAATLSVVLAAAIVYRAAATKTSAPPASAAAPLALKSIAVLPFLDLTDGMKEEEFADGMTEELIDKLSKTPGLRVPAPTASFYFKNKRVPVAEIGRRLGVAYVLDGSVRRSGGRLRVAIRLVRADDGYVIWSESYDRPWADALVAQDEIAAEVATAVKRHGIA